MACHSYYMTNYGYQVQVRTARESRWTALGTQSTVRTERIAWERFYSAAERLAGAGTTVRLISLDCNRDQLDILAVRSD